MTTLLLILLAGVGPDGPHYDDGFSCLPLSGGTVTGATTFSAEVTLTEGFEATGDFDTACTATPSLRYDLDGVQSCMYTANALPAAVNFLGRDASPVATGANQSGGEAHIGGGEGTNTVACTVANCSATDTVTLTIDGTNQVCTAVAAAPTSVQFLCGATDAACATNLAVCLNAKTGYASCAGAGCTLFTGVAGTAYVYRDPTEPSGYSLDMLTSDATAFALVEGVQGSTVIADNGGGLTEVNLSVSSDLDRDTGLTIAEDVIRIIANGSLVVNSADGGATCELGTGSASVTTKLGPSGNYTLTSSGFANAAADFTIADNLSVTGAWHSSAMSTITLNAATTIAVTRNAHILDCDGAETLTTITGGIVGQVLVLKFLDADICTVTDDDTGTANTIDISAAFLSTARDTLTLIFDGTSWVETSRAVN